MCRVVLGVDGVPQCDLVENGTQQLVVVILTGEVLLGAGCPCACSGNLCHRAERCEPSGVNGHC